ncbi:MAG: hypothetical protein Q8O61_00200 [Nocardioides sp.]|nr:hypothetical protein [Nocardioides sp.]
MFTIDPRVLRRASRDLIRHGLDLDDERQIPTPEAGRSSCVTQEGLERVLGDSAATADGLHRLGEALDDFVSSSSALDGTVSWGFDLLHDQELSWP